MASSDPSFSKKFTSPRTSTDSHAPVSSSNSTLLTNYRRAGLPAVERAMLDFAVKAVNGAHEMTGADIETMRGEGWSDKEVTHVIEIASMFSLTGRLANAFGLIANAEYCDLGGYSRPK